MRCLRYHAAMNRRRQREAVRKQREYQQAKAILWRSYIEAESYREARRILTMIWMLSI